MRIFAAVILVIGLYTLFWFLTTKPIQLEREAQITSGVASVQPGGLFPSWRDGVVRRIDDVSFWNSFTAALAAFLMYRAWTRVSMLPACAKNFMAVVPFVATWVVVAAVLTGLYLISVYKNPGTFWWLKKPTNTDAAIASLQFSEGLVNVLLIVAASALLPIGICLIRAIEAGLRQSPTPADCKALLRVCAALAGVVVAPFVSTLLAFGCWRLFKKWLPLIGGPKLVDAGSEGWVVVLFCVVLCVQFGILAAYAFWKLGQYVKPTFAIYKATWLILATFFFNFLAVLLFLAVGAEWRPSSLNPCAVPPPPQPSPGTAQSTTRN